MLGQWRKGRDVRGVGAPGNSLDEKKEIDRRVGRRQRARDRTDDQALERGAVEHSKRGRQQGRRREREQQPGARIGDQMRQFLRRIERREIDQDRKSHTSELQSLMRISYAVFCLKKQNKMSTAIKSSQYNN